MKSIVELPSALESNDGLRKMQRNKGVSGSIVLEELIEMHINPQVQNGLFIENRDETSIKTKILWQRLVDKLLDFIIPRLKSSKMCLTLHVN